MNTAIVIYHLYHADVCSQCKSHCMISRQYTKAVMNMNSEHEAWRWTTHNLWAMTMGWKTIMMRAYRDMLNVGNRSTALFCRGGYVGQILNHFLGVLSFSSSRLTTEKTCVLHNDSSWNNFSYRSNRSIISIMVMYLNENHEEEIIVSQRKCTGTKNFCFSIQLSK